MRCRGVKYRAIQWATGAMGGAVLRGIMDHPLIELVGVYVYSNKKCGKDAGDLVHRPRTGIVATDSLEKIISLDADVVLHCGRLVPPYGSHEKEFLPLLASGKNVVSINGYSKPVFWGTKERRTALEKACQKGRATLAAGGLNPGFIGEQLAVVASGVCQELDHVRVEEFLDASLVRDPVYAFDTLGFGSDPDAVDPNDPNWGPANSLNGLYGEVLAAMAEHLNLTIHRVETAHKLYGASSDLDVAAGKILKGRVSHTNWTWHGVCDGGRKLTMSIHWYMETTHLDNPNPPLWQVDVKGRPGVKMSVEIERRSGETDRVSAEMQAVAGSIVNTIPLVCDAEPGLMTRPTATPFKGYNPKLI
jgi:hypothetical protein